ncbi:MAG: leucine-rich repeat domain-containing protein [Spirochaetaceae bacterium]|jgi:hypothetical protein|nr:leucine-rich repeat domain-containing protein [Spirochaetaceae bacterium]
MLKTKLLIFLTAAGCLIPLAAQDTNLFITRTEIHNGERLIAITGYNGTAKTVVIPSRINGIPVRKIDDNAFKLKLLVEVTIPEGIEVIGAWAFSGNKLRVVRIPSSVKVIAPSAFDSNTLKRAAGYKKHGTIIFFNENDKRYNPLPAYGESRDTAAVVFLPSAETLVTAVSSETDSIQETPDDPAGLCGESRDTVAVVFLPSAETLVTAVSGETDSIQETPDDPANLGSESATPINLDTGGVLVKLNSESGIEKFAYFNAGLSAITIPPGAKFIGDCAFFKNNLTAVVIPPAVRSIGRQAFMGNSLISITIGENTLVQNDSFRYQFSDYYRMNKYKAGTYILKAGHWNFEGQEPAPKIVN